VGASYSFRDPEDVAVFDIGGGSVEIGIRSKGEEGYISIPFGCLVLLKRFPGCETDQARWNEMREFWAKELRLELQVPPKDLKFLIGTGGTMVSLAALKRHLHLKDLNPGLITGTELALEELEGMKDRLFLLPLESRGELPGLDPERAAPIMPGIAIVLEILSYFQKEKVVVSFEDLLEGVLVTNLRSQGDGT
jgi:exopolyphosphatase/pppGpp-phosphohydrolase